MKNLDRILSELGEFAYVRSYGNLGDLLIAEATEQYFARKKYKYSYIPHLAQVEEGHVLVHGGGARFTRDWCNITDCIKLLCNEHVKKCVILPSSFHEVDELLKHFDARHILFCRDRSSYEYCKEKCPTSQVFITDDMAIHLRLDELQAADLYETAKGEEENALQTALRTYLKRWLLRGVKRASVMVHCRHKKQNVAFLMRTDVEKKTKLNSSLTYDISLAWHTPPNNKYNGNLLLAFSEAVKQADIVVSDRLHVCIMAYHSGCEVYMLDNTYGKLQGVYELSLKDNNRVHLIQADKLPTEIHAAWKKLNNPLRVLFYKAVGTAKKIAKKILHK